jgi:hypothetical protein
MSIHSNNSITTTNNNNNNTSYNILLSYNGRIVLIPPSVLIYPQTMLDQVLIHLVAPLRVALLGTFDLKIVYLFFASGQNTPNSHHGGGHQRLAMSPINPPTSMQQQLQQHQHQHQLQQLHHHLGNSSDYNDSSVPLQKRFRISTSSAAAATGSSADGGSNSGWSS